ncbi:MAG: 50S ribosomal protein L9 [Rhodospirillaceae bacterium]|nr:50S ribosomal protein L9 [Rhodospirillaceae bacterium]MBT5840438.1 50S ribosomal protein L9 [Rhodospirillaceae bacterium]MBT6857313.1 50S ribosomal protein L9 [Rhodospirillaceae bacterium]MBT7231934.1 50S ribosomal protein L9 [Rhodospirillaceae bacterium]
MEVILLERIEKLGQMGDVVNVRSGYARNYLLPKKKAVTKTDGNMAYFESQRTQLEAANLENKSEAEKLSEKIEGIFIAMVRQAGDAGQLYGSVNARDIAAGAAEAGFNIERRQITLERPIKTLGLHPVTVSLHPEVQVTVTANVARSAEEAETQERTGEAVIKTDEDDADERDLLAEALSDDEPAEDTDADVDADAEIDAEVTAEAETDADDEQNPVDEGDDAEA